MMIQKKYLPFRFSRRGWAPDTLILRRTDASAEESYDALLEQRRIAHYHISPTGNVTAFAPVAYALRADCPEDGYPYSSPVSDDLRGILLLFQIPNGSERTQPQRRKTEEVTHRLQNDLYRTYGVTEKLTVKDETSCETSGGAGDDPNTLFRVQTGCYASRRDAEESMERLRAAGLAGYITIIRRGGSGELL